MRGLKHSLRFSLVFFITSKLYQNIDRSKIFFTFFCIYTFNRISITSPSRTIYSLPSKRNIPFARHTDKLTCWIKSVQATTSARIKPRSRSDKETPSTQTEDRKKVIQRYLFALHCSMLFSFQKENKFVTEICDA